MKSRQIRSFFWSVFSLIRTEYGEILRIYSRSGYYSYYNTSLAADKGISHVGHFFDTNRPMKTGENLVEVKTVICIGFN